MPADAYRCSVREVASLPAGGGLANLRQGRRLIHRVRRIGPAVIMTLLCAGCANPPGPGPTAPARSGEVFLLLDDQTLVSVSAADGVVTGRQRLRGSPVALAAARGDEEIYVLTVQALVAVDAATLQVRAEVPLPSGVRYRDLAVGPTTGHVYMFGDRLEADGVSAWFVVLGPRGTRIGEWRLRAADGSDWVVFGGTVAPDEKHALVSYHGERTTGADIVSLTDRSPTTCVGRLDVAHAETLPSIGSTRAGCVAEIHGRVATTAHGAFAATGDGERVMMLDYDGRRTNVWNPRLPGNHLMEVDVRSQEAFIIGSCLYSGGLTRIDLVDSTIHVLAPAHAGVDRSPPTICGERMAVTRDRLVAVAAGRRLFLVEAGDGRLRHSMDLGGTVVAVV